MNTKDSVSGKIRPDVKFLFSHPAHLVSLGFGSGLSPIVPGTAGTLFGWLVFHFLTVSFPSCFTKPVWFVITVLGFILGVWSCSKSGAALNSPDDGSMVWDEIIGIWLVLLVIMPSNWTTECIAFFLFRLFDMTKPPPIRQFDARLKGGLGVMFDDILAAIYAIIFYYIVVLVVWGTGIGIN